MLPWWLASLLSNVCIMVVEYANHLGGAGSWARTLPRTFVPIVIAQWCLYRAYSGAPNWLAAWAVFTLGNSVARVVGVAALAPTQVGNWYAVLGGVGVMMAGSLLLKSGFR